METKRTWAIVIIVLILAVSIIACEEGDFEEDCPCGSEKYDCETRTDPLVWVIVVPEGKVEPRHVTSCKTRCIPCPTTTP